MAVTNNIEITYNYVVPENKQSAEFWCVGGGHEVIATLEFKDPDNSLNDRTVYVAVNGEMYLTIPNAPDDVDFRDPEVYNQDWNETIIRYSDQLEDFGIHTDEDLEKLHERFSLKGYQITHNNPWWEIWSDDYPDGEVFDTFYQAIEAAIDFIKDDDYWEQY